MNFDTHWTHFEAKHGPQPLDAKEDALFWYNKGAEDKDEECSQTINELYHRVEDLKEKVSRLERELARTEENQK